MGTVEKVLMKRIFRIAVLAIISAATLSGCLVEKKDPVLIARTTDNLRVYEPGDYIDYYVTATSSVGTTTQTGILRLEWFLHGGLIRPGTTDPLIPVLKEVTSLTYNGASSAPPGSVKYISQENSTDPNPGQVTLYAIEGPGGELDWLSIDDITGLKLPTDELFVIFESPMAVGLNQLPISFFAMEGCDQTSGTCTQPFGYYSDDMNIIGDTTSITTNLGVFINPFRISFNGTTIPSNGFPIIDARNICGSSTTTHAGTMYVMPEIGIIQMTNTCNDALNDPVIYTITIRSTNIPLP